MAIKYYKLLDMLNKRSISKGELQKMASFSSATMAKLSSNKPVNLSVIDAICETLKCQPGDIMEHVPNDITEMVNNEQTVAKQNKYLGGI